MSLSEPKIVFICQPCEVEIKSLLLAYSLQQQNIQNKTVLVPKNLYNKLSGCTVRLFEKLNTEIVLFDNPYMANKPKARKGDWMSNKFYALKTISGNSNTLFLDSDIVCLDSLPKIPNNFDVAAKPADISAQANWELLYKLAKLGFPERKTRSTIDGIEGPPYFNSGVLWINGLKREMLASAWEKYFLWLSEERQLKLNCFDVFHRDQLALTLAIEELKLSYYEFSETMNYPARRKPDIPETTIFAHYHDCYSIQKSPLLNTIFNRFLKDYPEFKRVLSSQIAWRLLGSRQYRFLNMHRAIIQKRQAMQRFINNANQGWNN
jgi:lipopolysaccharide biosynthesis glycosyltransferase